MRKHCTTANYSSINDGIKEALKELSDKKVIIYEGKNKFFYTKELDKAIPMHKYNASSYNDRRCYAYWLHIEDNCIYIHLELCGINLNEKQKDVLDRIIKCAHPVNLKEEYKWKRVELAKKEVPEVENKYQFAIDATKELVNIMLKKEERIVTILSL